ncbi:MAG: hypothetical protein QW803_09695 [Candidatus Methanomethylicia archaeon]
MRRILYILVCDVATYLHYIRIELSYSITTYLKDKCDNERTSILMKSIA